MSEIVRSASVPFSRIVGFPGGPGPRGPVGPDGPKGDRGDQGPAGTPGTATINGFDVLKTCRLVGGTAVGGSTAADGALAWAKLVSFDTVSPTSVAQVLLAVTALRAGSTASNDVAVLAVNASQNAGAQRLALDVFAQGGTGRTLVSDAFKLVSDGPNKPAELWVQKALSFGAVSVYELVRVNDATMTVTYGQNSAWQSAEPVGSVTNIRSSGVTALGRPVGTRVPVPALPSSAGLAGQWAADDTNFYVYGASGWRRAALQTWTVANKVSEEDEEG